MVNWDGKSRMTGVTRHFFQLDSHQRIVDSVLKFWLENVRTNKLWIYSCAEDRQPVGLTFVTTLARSDAKCVNTGVLSWM